MNKDNFVMLQPNNVEAEGCLLDCMIVDSDVIIYILSKDLLKASDFFVTANGLMFDIICHIWEKYRQVNNVLVSEEVKARGLEDTWPDYKISELRTPSYTHWPSFVDLIRAHSKRRQGIHIATVATQDFWDLEKPIDESISKFETSIYEVRRNENKRGLNPISDSVSRWYDRQEAGQGLESYKTGLAELDKLLGGLFNDAFYILAGRPGMGKSALALFFALQGVLNNNKKVALFSLEMSEQELVNRCISYMTGIDSLALKKANITEAQWPSIVEATGILGRKDSGFHLDDTPALSVQELRNKSRRLQAEHGLDLLIVDYLQLMNGGAKKSENRQQEISYISRSLKELAKELHVPVLGLSQLSRAVESRHDKHPILSDLRESGSLEQDADVVMFVYRDEVYNPNTEFPSICEILIRKHRDGPNNKTVNTLFTGQGQFKDVDMYKVDLGGSPDFYKATNGNGNGHQNGKGQLAAELPFG